MRRTAYIAALALLTGSLTVGYLAWSDTSLTGLATNRWGWGLVGAAVTGAILARLSRHQPHGPRPKGRRQAYLVSFVTIGVIWLNHHWILEQVVRVDGPLLVLNLNMLLWTALLPFPTAVLAEYLAAGGEATRTAAALYSGVLVLLALAGVALFAWVIHDDRLYRLPPVAVRATRVQFLVGLAMYGVAFVLSWVSPLLALAVCGALALNHGRHHLRRRPADTG